MRTKIAAAGPQRAGAAQGECS